MQTKINSNIEAIIENLESLKQEVSKLNVVKETPSNYITLSPTMFSKIVNLAATAENQGLIEEGFVNELLKEVNHPVKEEPKVEKSVDERPKKKEKPPVERKEMRPVSKEELNDIMLHLLTEAFGIK